MDGMDEYKLKNIQEFDLNPSDMHISLNWMPYLSQESIANITTISNLALACIQNHTKKTKKLQNIKKNHVPILSQDDNS